MARFIVAIDQSTSATKALLFDETLAVVTKASVPHQQYYPVEGFVEHDAEELYRNTLEAARTCVSVAGVGHEAIAAIAITNQRETALIWDRNTDEPIANAAVWQCLRGKDLCEKLVTEGYSERVANVTGLVLDPYFSASKLGWMLDNVPNARQRAQSGDLLFGTIDSWLAWRLTGGKAHITDYSNACRTLLFDLDRLEWSDELFHLFEIPRHMAPELVASDTVIGTTIPGEPFDCEVPIAGLMGDSHAALFGERCFAPGSAKATYGTGSSIMFNIGSTSVRSNKGVVTSVGYGMESGITYALEGNIHLSAGTIQWLAEDIELLADPSEAAAIASSVPSTGGVYLVPALSGLGAPWWDNDARGLICGMNRGTKRAHIVRAAEESIAYQICDLLEVMQREAGTELPVLAADGGATRDDFLMQFQADIIQKPVRPAQMQDVSALGAASAAGIAAGWWTGLQDLPELVDGSRQFEPRMDRKTRTKLYTGWGTAVMRARWQGDA